MKRKRSAHTRLYRTKWLAPVVAVGLALGSFGLGQLAQDRIMAQPDQPITFIVDGEMPYGITQETVDAAAEDVAISYEPFTIMVVERELTWDESEHGELPEGVDVMLSVGIDPADLDLAIPAARRVSIAKLSREEDWMPAYRAASDVRATFLNNVTQGHGPNAVVGAALTAGSGSFDGGSRSPVLWVSIAALPLLAALLIIGLWARYIARERGRRQLFSRARLQLARVVLELDLLDLHMSVAGAELDRAQGGAAKRTAGDIKRGLTAEWRAIRADSLRLAQDEQLLTRELVDPSHDVHERGMPSEVLPLSEFATQTDALRRRVDALVAASSVRVGLSGGGTALEQIALSSTLAVDDVLHHAEALSAKEARRLQEHRRDLLTLLREAETAFGAQTGPEVVTSHAGLMHRWRDTESRLTRTLAAIRKRLQQQAQPQTKPDETLISQRVEERTRVATGGKLTSLTELRTSLGLASGTSVTPSREAERVLWLTEMSKPLGGTSRKPLSTTVDKLAPSFTPAAVVGIPIIAALVTGFVALTALGEDNTAFGRTLTGDQPLAALHVVGDTSLLPDITGSVGGVDEPANSETLTLGYVREQMDRIAEGEDSALLPEQVELIVAILPLDDFVEVHPHETIENRIEIDYLDLLDAYPRIKTEVATSFPAAIDPETGDVAPGFAILPLWIGDDDSFGPGLPLTGTLSTGVDSRLGSYYFLATEPSMRTPADDLSAGYLVAYDMVDLGREMEYNNQRAVDLTSGPLFWTVAITTWTGLQALGIIGWSVAQMLLWGAGSRRARRELSGLRDKLNKLALDLDLSRLNAVAVLGEVDGHGGQAAEADQQLYETMLFTAWREVQELENLPRRRQRGPEWRALVERMSGVIDDLAKRDTTTAERALELVRSYAPIAPTDVEK